MVTQREQWREIPGTDGMYEVSNRGRVRSWSDVKRGEVLAQQLRPCPNGRTFLSVRYRATDGKHRFPPVHTLVAAAFIGPRPKGRVVRHLNGDRYDNRAVNLAYGTVAECMADQAKAEALKIAKALVRAEMTGEVCPQGHERNAKNAYWHEGEYRCRTCTLEKLERFRREKPVTPLEELARPAALV